ncbi:DUF6053 domain-containing protein [Lysobacter enzymogenes]|uniref:DUF6053 domain-containing protein n=1 Tax=Lysobacter enzymogenes TaxID=69 RepID=UPI003D2F8A03
MGGPSGPMLLYPVAECRSEGIGAEAPPTRASPGLLGRLAGRAEGLQARCSCVGSPGADRKASGLKPLPQERVPGFGAAG